MKYTLILSSLFGSTIALAEYRLLDLDYAAMEYRKHENYRDAYFPQYETLEGECIVSKECFTYGASVLFDITLLQVPLRLQNTPLGLFWRNDVNMDATQKQVRHVSWKWEIGIPLGNKLQLFHRHHSRHVMEDVNTEARFPLRDEFVIKFEMYNRSK